MLDSESTTRSRGLIATYEALREQQRLKYCGGSLVTLVSKFQKVGASARCILK